MSHPFQKLLWLLAGTTAVSLVVYALASLLQAPPPGPDGFIPKGLSDIPYPGSILARLSPVFVLLYALSYLPVVVMFSIAKFREQPCGVVIGACLLVTSLILELVNALPLTSLMLAHPRTTGVSQDVLLYLVQTDAVRFLAFDVAGFTLAYVGQAIFALAFLRSHPWLARLTFGSIVLFVANVPFLWIAPWVAVLLMVLSILAFALIPLMLARSALQEEPRLMASTHSRNAEFANALRTPV